MYANNVFDHYRQHLSRMVKRSTREDYNKRLAMLSKFCAMHSITYGKAVIDIADLYYNNGDKLVHHLETGGVPISGAQLASHYSTIGYAYIARMVDKCVNDVVYQYRADTEIKEFGHYNLPTDEDGP